jgi:hypothetical protein
MEMNGYRETVKRITLELSETRTTSATQLRQLSEMLEKSRGEARRSRQVGVMGV